MSCHQSWDDSSIDSSSISTRRRGMSVTPRTGDPPSGWMGGRAGPGAAPGEPEPSDGRSASFDDDLAVDVSASTMANRQSGSET
jgi:hypothetical protein